MKTTLNRLLNLLTKYFDNAKNYSTFRLIVEFTLLDLIVKFGVGIFVSIFILIPVGLISGNGLKLIDNFFVDQNFTTTMSLGELAIISMVIFPPFETLIFQNFVIWFLSIFTKKKALLILISAIIFALIHLELTAILAIIPAGILLSWVYLIKKDESKWKAFYTTTILHISMNGLAVLLRLFFP